VHAAFRAVAGVIPGYQVSLSFKECAKTQGILSVERFLRLSYFFLKKSERFVSCGIKIGQKGNGMGNRDKAGTSARKDVPRPSLPDLIASYGDRLMRSAFLMCGRSGDAQDIVQETFCRALAALPDFREEAGVYTWLFTIMRNVYLQQRRSQWRFIHFLARQSPVALSASNPAEHCEQRSNQTQLLAAMQKLPARQREIVILRFVNDMKIADIARVLSLPQGTVKSRLFKASSRLQKLIGARRDRSLPVCEEAHEV
jgi:RNA polymerase sigma-70 factor (ECF subfamily)